MTVLNHQAVSDLLGEDDDDDDDAPEVDEWEGFDDEQ